MIRWPAPGRMSETSRPILERFKKVAVAKELEQDSREWVVVNWPWVPDPPYLFVLRASDGEERGCEMGEDGLWTIRQGDTITRPSAA